MATPAQNEAGRAARAERFGKRLEWFGEQLKKDLKISMRSRVRIATQLLRDGTVINISRPVTKTRVKQSRGAGGRFRADRIVSSGRSKRGEFPKADTTRLMKDVFADVTETRNEIRGIVGITLDYGLVLELKMDRSFLVRTLNEMKGTLAHVLTSGAGGGAGVSFK